LAESNPEASRWFAREEGSSLRRHTLGKDKLHAIAVYRGASDGGRGEQDRKVLLEALLPALLVNERETDRVIDLTIRLADAYEEVASHFETAFNCLLWGLTRRGGQAKPLEIEADKQLLPVLRSLCRQLPGAARRLRDIIEKIPAAPQIADRIAQTSPTPDAIRYRLLRDPLGPVHLAEMLLSVGHAGKQVHRSCGRDGKWAMPLFHEARERIRAVIQRICEQSGPPPEDLSRYLEASLKDAPDESREEFMARMIKLEQALDRNRLEGRRFDRYRGKLRAHMLGCTEQEVDEEKRVLQWWSRVKAVQTDAWEHWKLWCR